MGIPLGISLGKSLQLLRNENAVIVHPICAIWAHLAHLIDQSDCKMTTSYTINIYYCMTGRAIWGNIQFEAGSIGPSAARDNTEAEN